MTATAPSADESFASPSSGIGAIDPSQELIRLLKLRERREPAVVSIATWVGVGVIEGRLKPGDDLNSVELSHRFKTSRTPVREALMLLEQEGLVELRARRRPRVAEFTPERVQEIYQVRQHLLTLVGRLVAIRATTEEVDDLRERLATMRTHAHNRDIDGYFWNHVALQERMAEIAGNATLKSILDSLALRTLVLRHVSLEQDGRLDASLDDQTEIFRAIERRDPELTSMLLSRATRDALAAIESEGWTTAAAQHAISTRGVEPLT